MIQISDIFKDFFPSYLEKYKDSIPINHIKVANDIINCRTRKLGGEVYFCDSCGEYHYSYHSCKNRHCPKCGGDKSSEWVKKQIKKLLPVKYFLVTFTLPEELRMICRSNQKLFFSIMFKSASEALKLLLSDPKFLYGSSGFLGILHTWSRKLCYHPHIHFVVPGGAFNFKGNEWNHSNQKFLIPVKALSIIYRAKFRDLLREKNEDIFNLIHERVWKESEFITHSLPVGRGESAIKYLSNYIYRTAITNNRITSYNDGKVTYSYIDSKTKKQEYITVKAYEFIRRFLQHTLPYKFKKVRYYGYLSPASKNNFEKILNFFNIDPTILEIEYTINNKVKSSFNCTKCNKIMKHFGTLIKRKRAPPIFIKLIEKQI